MKFTLHFKYLLLLALFSSPLCANGYIELSPAVVSVDSTRGTTRPLMIDVRLGYSYSSHQLELALMTTLKDDSLNQLTVDVPMVASVFYHYLPLNQNSLKLHLILGVSSIEVESKYPTTAGFSESFYGASFGIGFEESFKSYPQLKMSVDWVQLYRGD